LFHVEQLGFLNEGRIVYWKAREWGGEFLRENEERESVWCEEKFLQCSTWNNWFF